MSLISLLKGLDYAYQDRWLLLANGSPTYHDKFNYLVNQINYDIKQYFNN